MTNDLTYAMLEVIDEMSPILEPKPNVRLHRNTPDACTTRSIEMIASQPGRALSCSILTSAPWQA